MPNVGFAAKWAMAEFETTFKSMVVRGVAELEEKRDHWVLFVKRLYKDGRISQVQKNAWGNPYDA